MKTDAELNRLISEHVFGYQWFDGAEGTNIRYLRSPDNFDYAAYEVNGVIKVLSGQDNYCTDPAAWGALFVRLAEQGKRVSLEANILQKDFFATVGTYGKSDPIEIGRALVLATLAAYGAEVEE